jgi:hypothetical protein
MVLRRKMLSAPALDDQDLCNVIDVDRAARSRFTIGKENVAVED